MGEGGGVGIEVVCAEAQVPKLAVGVAPKDSAIIPVFCCLEFSTMWVFLWAAGGETGKEMKFQIPQTS